jgi:hypothetical protein
MTRSSQHVSAAEPSWQGGKDHSYWSLVKTVRTPDGPHQKTLCYLGELNSSAEARWLTTVEIFNQQGEMQQLKRLRTTFPAFEEPAHIPSTATATAWFCSYGFFPDNETRRLRGLT